MAYWYNTTIGYCGGGWAYKDRGWNADMGGNFGPGYTEKQAYDHGSMYWNFDLRDLANRFPDFNLSAVAVQLTAKSHSGAHTIGYDLFPVYPNLGNVFRQYPGQYDFWLYNGAGALSGAASMDWWNRPYYKQGNFGLNRAIPFSELQNRPFVMRGRQHQPRRMASVYDCRIVAIEAWRRRPAFPGWTAQIMSENGRTVPGWASSLLGGGHWLSEFRGKLEYLGHGAPTRVIRPRFNIDNDCEGYINFLTGEVGFGIQNDRRCSSGTFEIGEHGQTWNPNVRGYGWENYWSRNWARANFPIYKFTKFELEMIKGASIVRHAGRDGIYIDQVPAAANGWVLKWHAHDWDDDASWYDFDILLFM